MAERSTAAVDLGPSLPFIDEPDYWRNWLQPERLSVSDWADRHRVLDPLFAAEPGPWRTDRAPYAREIMDSANLPWVRRVSWMASTQVGKSEAMNNVLGFYVHQKPSPAMVVLPNRDNARLAAERRVLPMVRASDALMDELTDRSHDVKNREIVFRRSVLYFRSASSPSDLASVPVRLVLGDECDKWPQWAGREASPLALAVERTRTFPDAVVMLGSTPTTRSGFIHREFEAGDKRRYYVPCPHCSYFQTFEWPRVKWHSKAIRTANQMRKQKEAWYECAACEQRIDDQHKRAMLREGIWVPEGKTVEQWRQDVAAGRDRNEHRSYHIWAAYSPWVTFWKIVAQFLDSKDDPALMMNFTNSWLAEVWEERVQSTSDEAIAACIDPDRKAFDVPDEVLVVTCAVDVQVDYMVWQTMGWGLDEEGWVLGIGQCETFEQLEAELIRPWGDQGHVPRCIAVDSRYRRDEVMDFARANQPVVRMIAGVERTTPVPFSTVRIDKHPRTGRVLETSLTVWTINVGLFKDLMAHRLRLALDSDQERPVGRFHLPSNLDKHWIEQMGSEHQVIERSGNKQKRRWVLKPGRKRNEAWDVTVYNAAAAKMIRADLLRSPERGGNNYRQPDSRARRNRRRRDPGQRGANPGGQW